MEIEPEKYVNVCGNEISNEICMNVKGKGQFEIYKWRGLRLSMGLLLELFKALLFDLVSI
jgi:hypothetical protein